MFVNVKALQDALLDFEPDVFVSHFLFDCTPYAFGRNQSAWIDWKHEFSKYIDIDARDVVLVGSAAIGYSLSPDNDFRPFGMHSDFDCGIISSYYFDVAWRYLRKINVGWSGLPALQRRAIKIHRHHQVFMGTIATDLMLGILPFGQDWQAAIDRMSKIEPTTGRDIKLRIYKDYDALRFYHSHNINRLRSRLNQEIVDAENGESAIEDQV